MGFDRREKAQQYTPQDGDTLRTIAERETAAGNEMSWQELAQFNWGTVAESEINEFLRDELGTRKRDGANNFVISSDDDAKGVLLIPQSFKAADLATERTHTLRVRKKVAPPQFLECTCIPGVTFAFDKSFVRPSVVDHLKALEQALAKHPDSRIMIFGHTDKVGNDQYNKELSERRAKSTFAFIVNDADTWEVLYNAENWGARVIQEILLDLGFDPGLIDGIYGPHTQAAIEEYQQARGLAVDGVAGPQTRKKMFLEYMTSKHDIQVTSDQFMDPRHMGCGEFNPVAETAAAHEPNRRVTIFLFHKDRLPKLPCKFVDLAPCRKQISPPSPRFVDTFQCSFFDSLARDCGCAHGDEPPPPVPAAATIEIIDAASAVATSVKMGLWDNAFDASGTVLNAVAEANNFAGADSRRFHFRVKDPSATGSFVNIIWKTLSSVKTDLDTAGAALTLEETPAGSKTFVSRGLLLTCDLDDVQQKTHSGLTPPLSDAGDRNRGQSNHRLKTAQMDGFVKGEYTPASGASPVSVELPVFERSPDERRRLPLQIFVLRVAAGGTGVIPTASGSTLRTTDVRVIKETYERIGVKLEPVVAPGTPDGDIVTVDGLSVVLIDPTGVTPGNISLADERTLASRHPSVGGNTARLFFVGGLATGNGGEAFSDALATAPGNAMLGGTSWTIQATGPYAASHELGHVLTDKRAAVPTTGHYTAPAAPAGNRLHNAQNHMKAQFLGAEGVAGAKRLWDANDGDGFNQFAAIRRSRLTRPF